MSAVDPVVEPAVEPEPVDRLLTASRSAHRQYRLAANPLTGTPNYALAESHVAAALLFRQQAHDLDPDHTAPGWQEDTVSHAELIAFYQLYGSLP